MVEIRYEIEEEELLDHDFRMPVTQQDVYSTDHQHDVPWPPMDADWLNSEDPAHQVDQFAQSLLSGDLFPDFEHPHDEPFGDSFFDSHHTSSYYENTSAEEPPLAPAAQYHELERVHSPIYQPPTMTPLRERDLNVPTFTPPKRIVVQKDKPSKGPNQRRPIDEFPTKNGFRKPGFSYSCLIALAMRNSTTGQLTVAEIYRFLCANFPFFQEAPSGWKNSVRHNLSMNKSFQKVETHMPDSQGRRSWLWCMNPSKIDKMTVDINKWRERGAANLELTMENPEDLDDIISGRKGMPPADELPLDEHVEWRTGGSSRRGKERSSNWSEFHDESPNNSGVLVRKSKFEPYDDFGGVDENFTPTSSSLNVTVHEHAARTFVSLLERKKLATVHPRTDDVEADIRSPQRQFEHPPLTLRMNDSSPSIPGPLRLLKPTIQQRSTPYSMGASESTFGPNRRHVSRPTSSQR